MKLGMWVWIAVVACSPSHDAPLDGGIGNEPPDAAPPDASGGHVISLSTTALTEHVTFGHSTHTAVDHIGVVADPGTAWGVSSDTPWITATRSATTGDGHVLVTVDASAPGVQLGVNTGTITVFNAADPSNAISATVSLELALPAIHVTPDPIVIGGADGTDHAPVSLGLSLDTGSNAWPWTATLATTDGVPWLQLSETAGTASDAPHALTVDAARGQVAPGRFHGSIKLTANVDGQVIEQMLDVAFNREGYWLISSAPGVAFSSFPNRKVLTRDIVIYGSQNSNGRPTLSVTSDQPWLKAELFDDTPNALLELTANPAGLAPDREYIADVAVHAVTGYADNVEHVRVGLWVGARAPVASFSTPSGGHHVIANPVEPWVYVSNDATRVYVYNVYTGGLVKTLVLPATRTGALAISDDGRQLFVNDDGTRQVLAVDAASGAVLRTYPSFAGAAIVYTRPYAHPQLVLGNGTVYDLTSNAAYANGITSPLLANGLTSFNVYALDTGLSPATLRAFRLSYSALSDTPLTLTQRASTTSGSNGQDLCVTLQGQVLSASASPAVFAIHRADNFAEEPGFPGAGTPNAIACGWTGVIIGGAVTGASPTNLWAYFGSSLPIASFALHPLASNNIVPRTVALSGDNTRVMALMAASPPDLASFNIVDVPVPSL